jgi:predicted nucleotidyltransferase
MSIADFLLTPRQQRILAPLLLDPSLSLRVSELLALSGSGRGATQKHIQTFVDIGLLNEYRQGNQRYLQINSSFALFNELRAICLKSFGLTDVLRAALDPLREMISEAFVFGSVANNTDRSDSDIDLMVVGSVSLLDLMEAIALAETQLARPVHVNLHDEQSWNELKRSDAVIDKIINSTTIRIFGDHDKHRAEPVH